MVSEHVVDVPADKQSPAHPPNVAPPGAGEAVRMTKESCGKDTVELEQLVPQLMPYGAETTMPEEVLPVLVNAKFFWGPMGVVATTVLLVTSGSR
jgi:hypothetical protein